MPRKPNPNGDRFNDPFPSRLRYLIWKSKTKQEDLMEPLGLKARQSVTGYTNGSTAPTAEKIAAIAKYFNVSADYLVGLSDISAPSPDAQKCKAELREKVFRYGMLYGLRTALNTVIAYLEEAQEHPEILKDALQNLSAVSEATKEEYRIVKEGAKQLLYETYGEEDEDEQQGQGEEV